MGQHTWFYRNRKSYEEYQLLLSKEDLTVEEELRWSELYKENEAPYHDCFRTFKREPDGEYTCDVIYSKEECDQWLKDNAKTVHDLNQERVDQFWEEFPDGVIDFG